jgi:MATE family multidrug resistance protein
LTGSMLRTWILAFIPITYYFGANFYLVSQGYFNVGAVIAGVAVPIHWAFCTYFVTYLRLELTGVALAETCTRSTMCLLIYLYTKKVNPWPEANIPWTRESAFEGFKSFSKEVIVLGSSILLELVTFEISTVLVGLLHNDEIISAHSLSLNLVYTMFTPIYGTSIASSVFVANAVGAQDVAQTRSMINAAQKVTIVWATLISTILLLWRDSLIFIYTKIPGVTAAASNIMLIFALGIHADGISNTLSYSLRAIGMNNFVLKSYCVTQYALALTLGIVLSFVLGFSYKGIWIGMLVGFYAMAIILFGKLKKVDFKEKVKVISSGLNRENKFSEIVEETSDQIAVQFD